MSAGSNSDLISAYADRLNPLLLDGHSVASPLGLWLLLALIGPATTGAVRTELEAVLGTGVDDAAARATLLLSEPHPAVSALCAVWDRHLGSAFDEWSRSLPAVVERGPVPDQARADAWTRDNTNGLIPQFPLDIDSLTRLLLASALATDIAWARPLGINRNLGGVFGQAISRALEVDDGLQVVVDTDAAGLVAVAAPLSSSGIVVLSVIAEPDVTPDRVGRAAHQVAASLRGDGRHARGIPLSDVADGHAWTVTERRETQFGGPDIQIRCRSYLPAWSASSDHDLTAMPGVNAAFEALSGFMRPDDLPADFAARQSAVARYSREGFRAAAVTAIGLCATGVPDFNEHEVLVRDIKMRFNRPYAVLACAADDYGPQNWRGVPIFSAWVTQPDDTTLNDPSVPQPVEHPAP